MPSAILLVAHGSRRSAANADLVQLAEMMREQRPGSIIEIGYLELAEPTIPAGLLACAQNGATSIAILPYFLSEGAHVAEDLVRFRNEFKKEFSNIDCIVCPPIGLHPKLVDLMLERLEEGVCAHSPQRPLP